MVAGAAPLVGLDDVPVDGPAPTRAHVEQDPRGWTSAAETISASVASSRPEVAALPQRGTCRSRRPRAPATAADEAEVSDPAADRRLHWPGKRSSAPGWPRRCGSSAVTASWPVAETLVPRATGATEAQDQCSGLFEGRVPSGPWSLTRPGPPPRGRTGLRARRRVGPGATRRADAEGARRRQRELSHGH
jgi:hypothetical protein